MVRRMRSRPSLLLANEKCLFALWGARNEGGPCRRFRYAHVDGYGWHTCMGGLAVYQMGHDAKGSRQNAPDDASITKPKKPERLKGDRRLQHLLDGKYSAGQFKFKAAFVFGRNSGLALVRLKLLSGQDCPSLTGKLSNTYGPPKSSRTPVTSIDKWWDSANQNVVIFLQIGDDYCIIDYSPQKQPGASGVL